MPSMKLLVLVAIMAAACATTTGDGSTSVADTARSTPTVCDATLVPGLSRIDCGEMSFDVAIPESCPGGSCGLIVDVHPRAMTSEDEEHGTGLQGIGNAAGYVVVQPRSPHLEWNLEEDSVSIRAFMERLIEALDLDPDRVHMGGASQGGYMTWLFVCDHADLIASAAPLAAGASTVEFKSCDFDVPGSPSEEVDILYMHGRKDDIVSFDTAIVQRDLVVAAWDMSETEVLADESTHRWTRWVSAEGTVFEFVEFDAGHCFPVGEEFRPYGCSGVPIDYGQAALSFYMAHPKTE